jgi:O-antigen/teichoic acid export membrane protein
VSIALRPRDLLDRIAQIWPLTASSMMWMLVLRMDQVIAGAMGVDHFDLGNYGAAVKLVEALVLFPGAVATAFQPRLARAWADSAPACSRQLRAALTASLALSVPIAVGGACLAPGLSILVYGDRFLSAGSLLAIQLLCLPFIGIQFLSTHALVAAGAIRVQALAVAVNLLVNLGCNLLLIPQLGVKGASASALCGGFAATLVYAWALRGTRLRPELLASAWRPVLSAAAMGLLLMEVRDRLPLFAAIGVGGAVYAAAFLSLGGLRALREMRGRGEPVKVPAARIELGER